MFVPRQSRSGRFTAVPQGQDALYGAVYASCPSGVHGGDVGRRSGDLALLSNRHLPPLVREKLFLLEENHAGQLSADRLEESQKIHQP